MSSEIAKREQPGAVSAIQRMSPDQLAVIKSTVAKGASDNELAMFLELASRYQLDPFAREIWCVKMGGDGMTIMAGRDGYLAIANRSPAFDGMESDVVHEGDTFRRTSAGIEHSYAAERGAIIGAYALVYRNDRTRPAYFFAPFSEYNTKKSSWVSYPSAMIVKVAEAMALKRAFSISGLVTQEEMDASERASGRAPAPADDLANETWRVRWGTLKAEAATAGMDADALRAALKLRGILKAHDLEDDSAWAEARKVLPDPDVIDVEPTHDEQLAADIPFDGFDDKAKDPQT